MSDKWRRVADKLAQRLANNVYCDEHGPKDRSPDCPFCQDIVAYEAYLAAGGTDWRPSFEGLRTVSVSDVAKMPPNMPLGPEASS